MGSLYKQAGSTFWSMKYTDERGKRVRRSTRTRNKTAAQLMLNEELRGVELRRAGVGSPSVLSRKLPISGIIDAYLEEMQREQMSTRWVQQLRYRLTKAAAEMGVATIAEVTTERLLAYQDEHLADRSHNTRKQYMLAFSGLCRWAMHQRPPMLAANPATAAMPRLARRKAKELRHQHHRRPLWPVEIPMLLGAVPERPTERPVWERFRMPLYAVAIGTGLRRGTLEQVTPSMVRLDVANPHIAIPSRLTKSGRALTMPLTDPALIEHVETLLRFAHARSAKHKRYHGRPFAPVPDVGSTFSRDLERARIPALDEAGYRVDFHSLRLTFCTQLAYAEVPIERASELMDHASIETTLRTYQMVGAGRQREYLQRLPGIAPAAPATMPRSMPS